MAKKKTRTAASPKKSSGKSRRPKRKKKVGKTNEEIMVDVIKALRENPEKWQRLQKDLKGSKQDKTRVRLLVDFATDERELASLMPLTASGVEAAAWTTVTVTTIFIASTAH